MDITGSKRSMDFFYSADNDASEGDKKGTRSGNNELEVDEFFSLVERLQAIRKEFKTREGNSRPVENSGVTKRGCRSPLKLCFEWEDFMENRISSSRQSKLNSTSIKTTARTVEFQNIEIEYGNKGKEACDKQEGLACFDLNVSQPPNMLW